MPQIILKERKAHLASYILLQGMLIIMKTCHFHSYQPPRTPFLHNITSYFHPVNIAKFLRPVFLNMSTRSSHLQMFFKIGVFRSFANFTEVLESLFKNLADWRPAT